MTRRMLRYRVYANDLAQTLDVCGDPLHVTATRVGAHEYAPHAVDFWAEENPETPVRPRSLLVIGTGHPIPDGARWWGTTDRTPDGLVWHLYEVPRT